MGLHIKQHSSPKPKIISTFILLLTTLKGKTERKNAFRFNSDQEFSTLTLTSPHHLEKFGGVK
jgi:hypothetical protein